MSQNSTAPYETSAGALHGYLGVILGAIGAAILFSDPDQDELIVFACTLGAAATYLIIAGAVARGVQLARLAADESS